MGYKKFVSGIMGHNFFPPTGRYFKGSIRLTQDPELEQVNVTGGRLLVCVCVCVW